MAKQILSEEFKRMQKLAGITNESNSASKFKGSKFGDEEGNLFSVEEVYDFVKKNKQKYFKPNFPISKIENNLEWWDKLYSLDNKEHKKRMMAADTSYPLLVLKDKNGLSVADGLNRLYKAVNVENKDKIDIYLVDKEDIMFLAKK